MQAQRFSAKKAVYENCVMLSCAGELLCHADRKKLEWYLAKGIAVKVLPVLMMILLVLCSTCPTVPRVEVDKSGTRWPGSVEHAAGFGPTAKQLRGAWATPGACQPAA